MQRVKGSLLQCRGGMSLDHACFSSLAAVRIGLLISSASGAMQPVKVETCPWQLSVAECKGHFRTQNPELQKVSEDLANSRSALSAKLGGPTPKGLQILEPWQLPVRNKPPRIRLSVVQSVQACNHRLLNPSCAMAPQLSLNGRYDLNSNVGSRPWV